MRKPSLTASQVGIELALFVYAIKESTSVMADRVDWSFPVDQRSEVSRMINSKQAVAGSVRFHHFTLDLKSLSLTDEGGQVTARPKVVQLLAFLVEHRERIVSKQEIATHVWGRTHVEDAAIFQVISAARKLAPTVTLIKTHPNRGYQWVAPVRPVALLSTRWGRALAASVIAAGVMFAVSFTIDLLVDEQRSIESTRLPPAVLAMQRGIAAAEQGQPEQSIAWFEFALAEQPTSSLLQLQLADALFAAGEVKRAMHVTQQIVDSRDADAYQKMAAWSLLGRAQFQLGLLGHATESASKVLETQPPGEQAQCTAEGTRTLLAQIIDRDPGNVRARDLLLPLTRSSSVASTGTTCTRLYDSPLSHADPSFRNSANLDVPRSARA